MTKKTKAAIVPPTIIEFLLDETGSMTRYLDQVIGGYADFIDEQRKHDILCLMTLTKFDTEGQRTPFVDLDIQMVPHLTTSTYVPTASTNLYDTIISRIAARRAQLETWDIKPRVLFVAMTDGHDNASTARVDDVAKQIGDASDDGWMFVYLGAYEGATEVGLAMGFRPENIRCFAGAKMRETLEEMSVATTAYRQSETVERGFYAAV